MNAFRVVVGCVKWGTRFGPDYVNVLYRGVREHMGQPFRFLCVTEQPGGLDPGIETVPFPDFGLPPDQWRKGSWPKISLFAPEVTAGDEIVLYFDLDVMIVGPLDPLVDLARAAGGFHTLREWNPKLWRALPLAWRPMRGSQGSVYAWRAAEQRHVFAHFRAHTAYVRANFKSDRFYLPEIAVGATFLPYDWCQSFKNACVWYWPLNHLFAPAPPEGARVIVFHGRPRPLDLMRPPGQRWGSKRKFGTRPVPWVRDYWTGHGGSPPAPT